MYKEKKYVKNKKGPHNKIKKESVFSNSSMDETIFSLHCGFAKKNKLKANKGNIYYFNYG